MYLYYEQWLGSKYRIQKKANANIWNKAVYYSRKLFHLNLSSKHGNSFKTDLHTAFNSEKDAEAP